MNSGATASSSGDLPEPNVADVTDCLGRTCIQPLPVAGESQSRSSGGGLQSEGLGEKAVAASNTTQSGIPIVSLFCGPGGMDLGFEQAGFDPVLALDSNWAAVKTYNANRSRKVARQCDLSELSGDQLVAIVREASPSRQPRGVIGGPPCQAFSLGNTRKKRLDPRARLGLVFAKLVEALNVEFGLDFFVFENVVGLKTKRHRHRFANIKRALRRAGFNLFVQELDAGGFGVAQRRRRLFIVGINRYKFPWLRFSFPDGKEHPPTVRETISALPDPVLFRRGIGRDDIPVHPNHWTMYPRSAKFLNGIHGNGRSFKRLTWDKTSYTVAYGNREIHIHPEGKRRLSVLEAMLLQGFPRSYELFGSLSDQITQVCDAVPPALAAGVAGAIQQCLYDPIMGLQTSLLQWFAANQRHFPWRMRSDPFQILVAEKLLQQTAATETVSKAFDEIVSCYPDWKALAQASHDELHKIVHPLGLAYRAGDLIAIARQVHKLYRGTMPRDLKALMKLPGVGDYCARAVMSFAFGERFAAVDTNVARFLARYLALPFRLSQNPARDRRLQSVADALVPFNDSRSFNLAVLDLCAMHCRARGPTCFSCPISNGCAFRKARDEVSSSGV